MKEAKGTILTPLISLDTPGKATVQVVILGDPDGQEICFVGSEAFRELSQVQLCTKFYFNVYMNIMHNMQLCMNIVQYILFGIIPGD